MEQLKQFLRDDPFTISESQSVSCYKR